MKRCIPLALILACGSAGAMTDAERDVLRQAARADAPQQAPQGTGGLLYKLGNARDVQALDELIALHNVRMLRAFAEGWGPAKTTPEYEARVLRHFDDRDVAAVLIENLYEYHDPALFEALYRDAEMLARWRAERRRGCRAQIALYQPIQIVTSGAIGAASPRAIQGNALSASPVPGGAATTRGGYSIGGAVQRLGVVGNAMVGWNYACERGAPDSMALDLDGRPHGPDGRRNRESASVEAIARNEIPGTEARLAPLFRDLSLYPLPDWKLVSVSGEAPAFRTAYPPVAFLSLYTKRLYAPAPGPILDVLKEMTPIDRAFGALAGSSGHGAETDRDTWWSIIAFHTALVPSDAPEATRALAVTIERAAAIERAEDRRDFLSRLVPLLGPVVPQAQVDLNALKARVLDRAPYDGVAELSRLFTRVEADNRSLREPSAASLTRWIDNTHWRRVITYLLAHGADPNQRVGNAAQPPLVAAAYRNETAAFLLLDKGADVGVRASDGKTALHAACDATYGNAERIALATRLIAKGADANAVADMSAGQTPLHLAASASPKCVRALLAAGAKLEAPDRIGRTPLAWAAGNNNVETARLLLDAGADPNREDKEGGTPYAAAYDRPEARALLESRGGRLTAAQIAKRAYIETILKGYRSH